MFPPSKNVRNGKRCKDSLRAGWLQQVCGRLTVTSANHIRSDGSRLVFFWGRVICFFLVVFTFFCPLNTLRKSTYRQVVWQGHRRWAAVGDSNRIIIYCRCRRRRRRPLSLSHFFFDVIVWLARHESRAAAAAAKTCLATQNYPNLYATLNPLHATSFRSFSHCARIKSLLLSLSLSRCRKCPFKTKLRTVHPLTPHFHPTAVQGPVSGFK